jgi:hypothetical protein
MSAPLDDPLRRVADLPPRAEDRAAADQAMAVALAEQTHPEADTDEEGAGNESAGREGIGAEVAHDDVDAGEERGAGFDIPAGQAVGARLSTMLDQVFSHEPPVGGAVREIFNRAEAIRRRRARVVVIAGTIGVILLTIFGYALTTVLLPATPTQSPGAEAAVQAPPKDPVLALLTPVFTASALTVTPREPARGDGWRQYLVLTAAGKPHGLVEVAAFAAPDGLCFPVLADKSACARPERASDNVEYVRYTFDRDVDWQTNEVIARRLSDGRVIVIQSSGERGTGKAQTGRPPLTALLAARLAADPRMAAAFGAHEACNGPDPACPILKVPVPVVD